MTARPPQTHKVWELAGDADIAVSVMIADENYTTSGTCVQIISERDGLIYVTRSGVADLIEALQAAEAAAQDADNEWAVIS